VTPVLVALVLVPLAVTVACGWLPQRVAAVVTAVTGLASFAACLSLVPRAAHTTISVGFLRVDALSAVFLLATSFLYAATAVYSIGYLADEARVANEAGGADAAEFARYSRRFYLGLNAFAWSMLCAPAVDGLALLWIAIEITTVVSALLVAIDDTEGATEAAWKYVLIASSGLGIGLLATIVMYYAGAQALGESYDLAFGPLFAHAHELPATPVRLAFVLAVVGYGTKVGLFPVHTWLPDAHAEAPTPVSALLSGALLATSFYAILRYYQIAAAAVGTHFPRTVLLVFGVLSLLLAALYVLDQYDVKRLLAYSSVEHMGILAIGVSFGVRIAFAGVLLHVLAHAAAKGNAFMGAGVLVRKYGTKDLARIRDGVDALPWSGPLFLVAVLALSAMPPFGLFRSEFEIVAGGFAQHRNTITAALIVLVTLAFLGVTAATTRMLYAPARADGVPARGGVGGSSPAALPPGPAASSSSVAAVGGASATATLTAPPAEPGSASDSAEAAAVTRGEPSVWMVLPALAGVVVLLVLGVHPPADLVSLLDHAAAALGGQ
jgi:hydrogenase-4 component F